MNTKPPINKIIQLRSGWHFISKRLMWLYSGRQKPFQFLSFFLDFCLKRCWNSCMFATGQTKPRSGPLHFCIFTFFSLISLPICYPLGEINQNAQAPNGKKRKFWKILIPVHISTYALQAPQKYPNFRTKRAGRPKYEGRPFFAPKKGVSRLCWRSQLKIR